MALGNLGQNNAYGVSGYGGAGGYSAPTDPISQFAARTMGQEPMRTFDPAQRYLDRNPDVRQAAQDDSINSVTGAWQHYQRYGQDEGRQWPGMTSQQNTFSPSTGQGAMAPTAPAGGQPQRDPEDELDEFIAARLARPIAPLRQSGSEAAPQRAGLGGFATGQGQSRPSQPDRQQTGAFFNPSRRMTERSA